MFRALISLTILCSIVIGRPSTPVLVRPTPPGQPAAGPGGREYPFEQVDARHIGAMPTGYWLFSPVRAAPTELLPVIVFLHGFSAVNPATYRDWIDHIVRRGAVVLFPDYQTGNPVEIDPGEFQANAIASIQSGIGELADGVAGNVNLTQMAIVGHSLGGVLALNIAARSNEIGLQEPVAVMPVEPGGCSECGGLSVLIGQPYGELSSISNEARVVVIVGDQDTVVGSTGSRIAWDRMTNVPLAHRDYVVLRSDRRGEPDLIADHYAPETGGASGEVDALDWFGTWKFLDLLMECAFFDRTCEDALGGSTTQFDMGTWSDGRPVRSPTITDGP